MTLDDIAIELAYYDELASTPALMHEIRFRFRFFIVDYLFSNQWRPLTPKYLKYKSPNKAHWVLTGAFINHVDIMFDGSLLDFDLIATEGFKYAERLRPVAYGKRMFDDSGNLTDNGILFIAEELLNIAKELLGAGY